MKKRNYIQIITVILLCIGTIPVLGQSKITQKETDKRNNVSFAKFTTDTIILVKDATTLLKKLQPQMKEADAWKLSTKRKEIKDADGYTHQFYQQYYKGIKVEGGEFGVHAVNGNIESVLGEFEPVEEVPVTAKFSEEQALKYALKYIGAEVYKWQIPEEEQWIKEYYNDTYYPVGELVIVKDRLKTDRMYRLAYRFDIYAHKPMSRNYVWVDAITGEIINMDSRIHFSNVTGTAATRYSGSRSITTDSYNGRYRLRETRGNVNISTFNMNHTGNYTSTDFTDNDNNWTAAEFHNVNNDDVALDAHWGAERVYEYFKQVHLRNSWNNSNGPLLSYVNANLPQYDSRRYRDSDNAFWDGNRMTYGQGTFLPPLTTLDICAHEIAHGICQSTAGLAYQGESGAINESLSDIWAACVENWATTNKQPWLIGEDLGFALRNMSNPKQFGQPNTYQSPLSNNGFWFELSGCTPDSDNDYCGVHRNSGVGNFWFFLLSQGGSGTNDNNNAYNVAGISITKAARIVYTAETAFLTSSANYAQFRNATISAAIRNYGRDSPEMVSVTNAWHAVGIGDRHPPVITGPSQLCLHQSSTFTVSNVELLGNYTWTCSSSLIPGSASGNSKTFYANSSSLSWVAVNLGTTELARYYVGTVLTAPTIYDNTIFLYKNGYDTYDNEVGNYGEFRVYLPGNSATVNYEWGLSSNYSIHSSTGFSSQGNNHDYYVAASTTFYVPGSYYMYVNVSNGCGSAYASKYVTATSGYGYYSAYPNPASNILNIEIDQQAIAQAKSLKQTTTAARQLKTDPTYDIRLYDYQGNLLRQQKTKGGTVQFNVTNLTNGIYYLHIFNGENEKPEMRQVVVEH